MRYNGSKKSYNNKGRPCRNMDGQCATALQGGGSR